MKRIVPFFLFLLALQCVAHAQDIRSKVKSETPSDQFTDVIDSESGIFGIPYGASEDELIAKLGMPIGYLRLSPGNTAMIFGKSRAFLFSANKLIGVRITDSLLDWKLSLAAASVSPCEAGDRPHWKLNNGIKDGMNMAEVKNLLGQSLSGDKYQTYYETTTSRVELDFAHYEDEGDTDKAYRISGLLVKKR